MKKFERILGFLFVIQILFYIFGLNLTYKSTHDGMSSFVGFGALIPFGIFIILGIINLILLIIDIVRLRKKGKRVKAWLLLLIIINVVLLVGYNYFVHIVTTLPGSDLPGYN